MLAFGAWLGVALAGCARFQPEPISPATNAAALDSRSLDDPRLIQFIKAVVPGSHATPVASGWDLEWLTLAAVYFHPDLAIARARLAGARADIVTARQRPNPSLSLGAAFDTAAAAGAIPPGALAMTVGPAVNFVIETFGKREDRTSQARHLAEAARAAVATAAWQLRGQVRSAWLNLWAADRRLTLGQAQLQVRQKLVGLLEDRLTAGFAAALDVERERIALAQAMLGIDDQRRLRSDALVQLATALAIPVHALDHVAILDTDLDESVSPPNARAAERLRNSALTGRADVQAALAEYEATQAALRLAVANQFPNIVLAPSYDYDSGINKYGLSPTLDLPISNQNQGQIARAAADRRQAAANLTAVQARALGQIDAAFAACTASMQSLRTAATLLAGEQRRLGQAEATFRAGQADRPTLLGAQLVLAAVRGAQFDSIVQQRQALGALEDALQQPLFGPDFSWLSEAVAFRPHGLTRTTP